MKVTWGALDTWRSQAQNLVAFINTLMIAYLFIDKTGWLWWYWIVIIFGAIFMVFYVKVVYPSTVEFQLTSSKSMKKIFDKMESDK